MDLYLQMAGLIFVLLDIKIYASPNGRPSGMNSSELMDNEMKRNRTYTHTHLHFQHTKDMRGG